MNDIQQAGLRYVSPVLFARHLEQASIFWVRPVSIAPISVLAASLIAGEYLPLAGGHFGFTHLDLVIKTPSGPVASRQALAQARKSAGNRLDEQLERITAARPNFAGLDMGRVQVMGVVNVTPDSFSDGGQFNHLDSALSHARQMLADGASILDIGGESTRPGAAPVSRAEELARILPVITALSADHHLVSADTRHASIMALAQQAGAKIINDVSGFREEDAARVMGKAYAQNKEASFAIAMHMQGTPQTMQDNPVYDFAPIDVFEGLKNSIAHLEAAGLPRSHIAIDPGFGFGKTPQHNRQLIEWTALFHGLGVPILIGVSRKSSIPILAGQGLGVPVSGYGQKAGDERLGGGIALSILAAQQGAQLFRTHDVAQTYQALAILTS